MTSGKNPIHVRLLNFEAVNSKKDLLFSEENILKILQSLQNYRKLRQRELQVKSDLYSNLKKINTLVNSLQKKFPTFKTPKKLKKFEHPKKTAEKKNITSNKRKHSIKDKNFRDNNLESQIGEIHEKLQRLSS